jgi:hypothetical protein
MVLTVPAGEPFSLTYKFESDVANLNSILITGTSAAGTIILTKTEDGLSLSGANNVTVEALLEEKTDTKYFGDIFADEAIEIVWTINGDILELIAGEITDPDRVAADKAALTWSRIAGGNSAENNVLVNLAALPTVGVYGTTIAWASDNTAVISNSGVVTRPAYGSGDATVTLTATIKKGTAEDTVEFTLTVKEMPENDAQAVADDKAALTWSVIAGENTAENNVLVNLATLPASGANGTTITWASNNTAVISNSGAVTRPIYGNGDATVTLTATIKKGTTEDTVVFTLIVKEMPQNDAAAVAADKVALTWGVIAGENTAENNVLVNLAALPANGTSGTTITWTSNNAAVLSNSGAIIRPVYGNGDATVTLTATIRKGAAEDAVVFTLIVKEMSQNDTQAVAADKAALTWSVIAGGNSAENNVMANLAPLPSVGANGTTITWASDNTAVVSNSGEVTRPAYGDGDATVMLTATLKKGSVEDTVVFTLTVKEMPQNDAEAVATDKAALTWSVITGENAAENNVLVNLAVLPSTGASGTTITWSSNNITVVSNSGAVTRPVYGSGDATVTLTATIKKGAAEDSVVFTLIVKEMPPMMTDEEIVAADKTALTWDSIKGANSAQGSTTSNLTLPTTGTNGSTITWASSAPAIISATGAVTRPTYSAGNQTVTLTATITSGDVSETVTFTLTVIAQSRPGDPYIPPNNPDTIVPDTKPPLADLWYSPYSDVDDPDEWFYEAVRFVTESGLMNGTGGGKFAPKVIMTRAMLVTVLYRLEGKPVVSGDIPLPDVENGEWYTDAILWASQNGIVYGYSNGTFGWNDPVTREQAVVLLYRYAKFKGLDVSASVDLSKFADIKDISDWALDAMRWAVAVGIVQGRPGNKTAPTDTSTRAEIAMIFKRYIDDFLGEDEDSEE